MLRILCYRNFEQRNVKSLQASGCRQSNHAEDGNQRHEPAKMRQYAMQRKPTELIWNAE
jgi:hypothetical protein